MSAEGYLSECEDRVRTLEWQLSEATKANEWLKAAAVAVVEDPLLANATDSLRILATVIRAPDRC